MNNVHTVIQDVLHRHMQSPPLPPVCPKCDSQNTEFVDAENICGRMRKDYVCHSCRFHWRV
jgi:transposase-like protein